MARSNSYSRQWFEFFHDSIGEERTSREAEFICQVAPLPGFRRLLDVCCGNGRHARALSARGYSVTGIERDAVAITKARGLGGGPEYIEADVRDYEATKAEFDLAIVMSQSFGYFDAGTNRELLRRLAANVRSGGRIILDVWNPEFFTSHVGERVLDMPAGKVREHKRVNDGRLIVRLTYPDGNEESFDWQLFTPTEMESLAGSVGLSLEKTCANFNPATIPTAGDARLQFVLERRSR